MQKQPPEVFHGIGVLKNIAKFAGKYLCQGLLFDKVAGLKACNFIKYGTDFFAGNFAELFRAPFLQNTFGRLLLSVLTVILKKGGFLGLS